jgi:ESX secretion-associated protein EspG
LVAGGFECSLLELDIVGDAFGWNVRQFPFNVPVHGETIEERGRFIEAVHRSLTAKGLVGESSYDPALERLVDLFCRGRTSIAALGTARSRSICVRASTDGRHAVLVRRRNRTMRFEPITPESLVRSVVALLPPMRAGSGGSVTLAVPDAGDSVDDFGFLESLRPASDATAEEILRRPRRGSGYFVVTERGNNGMEGDAATLNWVDTDAGRYVIVPSVGTDGRRYGTYAPADLRRVEQNLSRLIPPII